MSSIQIAEIARAIPELEYDGTEGYVVESDGEYRGQADTLDAAKALAVNLYPDLAANGFRRKEPVDYWGRATWDAR